MKRRVKVNNTTVLHNGASRATVKGDETRSKGLCI